MTSVEGTPDDDYPPSSPVQELDQHQIQDAPVLLGVGMAGQGHWSVSHSVESRCSSRRVEDATRGQVVEEAEATHSTPNDPRQPPARVIRSDMACSQKLNDLPAGKLGSTYRIDDRWQLVNPTPAHVELHSAGDILELECQPGSHLVVEATEVDLANPSHEVTCSQQIRIEPVMLSTDPTIATRWIYDLSVRPE